MKTLFLVLSFISFLLSFWFIYQGVFVIPQLKNEFAKAGAEIPFFTRFLMVYWWLPSIIFLVSGILLLIRGITKKQ